VSHAERFDRITGCESLASSERAERLLGADGFDFVEFSLLGHSVKAAVLRSTLWQDRPAVWKVVDGDMVEPSYELRRAAVEAVRERYHAEERATAERERVERAIEFLKVAGRLAWDELIERWVLT